MDYNIVDAIVKAVVLIICGVITYYVKPMIQAKVSEQNLETIRYYAQILVEGAEQRLIESGKGAEKLAQVTELLSARAQAMGLKLSADDIRLIIESAVKTMKENM